jgi:hypothetical protein
MPYRDPAHAKNYQREYRRLRRAGECTTPSTTRVPTWFRLETARDVLDLLAEQFAAIRSDESITVVERARTVGYLASVALRAIEAGDLAARIESVEQVLKGRGKSRR